MAKDFWVTTLRILWIRLFTGYLWRTENSEKRGQNSRRDTSRCSPSLTASNSFVSKNITFQLTTSNNVTSIYIWAGRELIKRIGEIAHTARTFLKSEQSLCFGPSRHDSIRFMMVFTFHVHYRPSWIYVNIVSSLLKCNPFGPYRSNYFLSKAACRSCSSIFLCQVG